jgi:hypothetical protein
MSWHGVDHIDGKERRFYSVRLITLCCALAATVSALVCIVVLLALTNSQNESNYKQAVEFCRRANDTRTESNLRIPEHIRDAKNLSKLALTLSRTRKLEADFFEGVTRSNPDPAARKRVSDAVAPLVKLLRHAQKQDEKIAHEQRLVSFDRLRIYDCSDPGVIRKP